MLEGVQDSGDVAYDTPGFLRKLARRKLHKPLRGRVESPDGVTSTQSAPPRIMLEGVQDSGDVAYDTPGFLRKLARRKLHKPLARPP